MLAMKSIDFLQIYFCTCFPNAGLKEKWQGSSKSKAAGTLGRMINNNLCHDFRIHDDTWTAFGRLIAASIIVLVIILIVSQMSGSKQYFINNIRYQYPIC